jgi:hypothetical protein
VRAWLAAAALSIVSGAAQAQAPAPAPARGQAPTPMAERVATIGLLEKRTTRSRFVELRPGQLISFGTLTVAVRACESNPPWDEPMSGAFVQIDERGRDGKARRIFSGWLFAPLAALNPFEHPRYDVWIRSCAMRFPERGPDTVVIGSSESTRSNAKKSARRDTASESNAR